MELWSLGQYIINNLSLLTALETPYLLKTGLEKWNIQDSPNFLLLFFFSFWNCKQIRTDQILWGSMYKPFWSPVWAQVFCPSDSGCGLLRPRGIASMPLFFTSLLYSLFYVANLQEYQIYLQNPGLVVLKTSKMDSSGAAF